jgi:hypothetical protein
MAGFFQKSQNYSLTLSFKPLYDRTIPVWGKPS